MTLTALLQDPSARENCLTHKPSSVLIGDQAGLKISSSSKSCFGHMAAAASAAATTGRPAAEAAADDPNSQPAFNGWRPKPLHENADMLLHRLLSRHWESRSWELQAAASQLPWQQQLTPAVTKRKQRKIATIEALLNQILTLSLRAIHHHLHPPSALMRRPNLFKPANGICSIGQSLPKQRICPYLTHSYQQARCPALERVDFQKGGEEYSILPNQGD